MIYRIARKECIAALRNQQVLVLGILILVLLSVAIIAGFVHYTMQQAQIEKAQHEKREQWVNQGEKHPHMAAHFGTFIFKPKMALSFFDFGLDAYTGTAVYLEAHFPHEFMFRPAQDYSAMIRFGELSAALVLQVLLPLLIIFLCFASFTAEKENQTIKLLVSQGVALRTLAWGKIAAYYFIVVLLLIPTVAVAALLSLGGLQEPLTGNLFGRTALLALGYGMYFFIFIGVCVLVSAHSRHSRNALLTLLTLWMVLVVLVPKATANLGDSFFPLPSMTDYKAAIKEDIEKGLDGKSDRKKRAEALKKAYLATYKVDSIARLPLNFEGISMQAGEEYGNKVHDVHLTKLLKTLERQNQVSAYTSLLNPYLAMRNLSMALSATDFHTSVDFQRKAEHYRRYLVREMNMDMAHHSKLGEFYEYKADKALWESIKDFSYSVPSLRQALQPYLIEIIALLLWLLLVPLLIHFTINQAPILI